MNNTDKNKYSRVSGHKVITCGENVECIGHNNGKLLFRMDTIKSKKLEFYHKQGSDHIKTKNGSTIPVSEEIKLEIDQKQEEYSRYISTAINSRDGFSKYVFIDNGFGPFEKTEFILCFKEVETDEYAGWRSFLECIVIEKCEAITGEIIEYSSYGICEVENVVKYSISTSQGSLKLDLFFYNDVSAGKNSEQLKKYLPEINQSGLFSMPGYVSSVLIYALDNKKWLMASKILDEYHLLSKSECKKMQNRKKQ